ncbi:hypothetical protein BMG03_19470 (plasmid) [Thioclava nitratireducens]|uniref:Uncharacterized protein n=1 Tax=Thioclava nitratireducens TaxID=1915078 RepID=A0ABM6IN30_9RHOB|nr:hypothetical protein [Thioclava nitratireducens]AQS50099.1 hypothetical protein BMG03_19470 [Thioclava nitratireducens]
MLIFGVLYATLLRQRAVNTPIPAAPFSRAFRSHGSGSMVRLFDNLLLWTIVSIALVAAFYGPVLWAERVMNVLLSGLRVW